MRRQLLLFFSLWAAVMAFMVLSKVIFMAVEPVYSWSDLSAIGMVICHGFGMDLAMSAYLVAPVVIWCMVRIWVEKPFMTVILYCWLGIIAFALAMAYVFDAVLFPFWNFRLDITPLFYLYTSPAAAFASLPWWANILIVLTVFAVAAVLAYALCRIAKVAVSGSTLPASDRHHYSRSRILASCAWAVIGAALVIPIRGGVTVSTMSPGQAFFCSDMNLNNAAVNPMFNFMYSLSHSDNLKSQFRFFDRDKVNTIVSDMYARKIVPEDSVQTAAATSVGLKVKTPDIYLIILESFSSHLIPVQGGQAIAVNLDSLARGGVLFSDFYAESFRTDRALPAILSGFPAQPTTSTLRFINKFANIPSLATALKPLGYSTNYYYGGDINFTNLKAYLVAADFDNIVADSDFPISKRLSKWGAHDAEVFGRALLDAGKHSQQEYPRFSVIQTSSSHEPYDVPVKVFDDKRANAFAYADKCLGDFVTGLKSRGLWDNSLLIIVPDHWGSYPPDLTDYLQRHHIPLVFAGGALKKGGITISRTASQSAIAATVSALVGADSRLFPLSRNVLDRGYKPWAWMCEPSWMAIKTPDGLSVMATASDQILKTPSTKNGSSDTFSDVDRIKAFVQNLYDTLDER